MSLSQKDLRRDFCLKTFGQRSRVLQLIKAFRCEGNIEAWFLDGVVGPVFLPK